jgi:regulator-associated protein of mTOR
MTRPSARPKGPQPVLDDFIDADAVVLVNGQPYEYERPNSPSDAFDSQDRSPLPLARSSTQLDLPDAHNHQIQSHRDRSSSPDSRPTLLRAKSDFGPRHRDGLRNGDIDSKDSDDGEWGIRHGFETQLVSEEYNNLLISNFFHYFTDKKHETGGNPKDNREGYPLQEWRMRDRLKTVSAVLALCLNIGVDPPDVVKTSPCAKMECWIDPSSVNSVSSGNAPLNQIGKALQTQYEQLSMRTRYKCALDPTVEETRKLATGLRKNARNERVLFHYNGHGVPKPTSSGEIWVFNRNYTQYIPISLYDLQTWVGAPSIFVWDCAEAGLIIQNFLKMSDKHQAENAELLRRDPTAEVTDYSDCIHLAACQEKENLPSNPDLPADVFTSCLTTPIPMAVRFFILQNPLPSNITLQDASKIPGTTSERRTPLGELNWIFTAITDTIAWDVLPKPLFKKLFRQDLMVAALYRNFLLAQRVMRKYHCTPQCYPDIPPTHDHPLWQSWDLAVESTLAQLPDLQAAERGERSYEYQHSTFFSEQLTAFQVYLSEDATEKKIPEQLPVVLQVLLSQVHRLRALILLSKFLDLGPWAVNLALGIGIFPYVLKLLQSQAMELKPVMVFIWARILAVDQSCQTDLLKDNGYQYFIQILNPAGPGMQGVANVSEHRAMCAFIIAMFCKDFHQGQTVCVNQELIESCLNYFNDVQTPLLRQWACLCLSMLWVNYPDAKWMGIKCSAHQRLCDLVVDCVAEVRAAMLHALTSFLGIPDLTPQVAQIEESIASMVLIMASDGNAMVRKELLVFFSTFIARYESRFLVTAYEQLVDEKKGQSMSRSDDSDADGFVNNSSNTIVGAVWKEVLIMSVDPHPEIAENACVVVDYVFNALLKSPLASYALPLMQGVLNRTKTSHSAKPSFSEPTHVTIDRSRPATPDSPTRQEGYFTASLKRTASVAASLKNLAFGYPPSQESTPKGPDISPTPDRAIVYRSRANGELNRPPTEKDNYHVPSAYPALKKPMPRGYKSKVESANDGRSIPLKSKFFEWAVEYFREPQMKPSEADEPGSTDYNERLWRRNRNDRIIAKTQPQKEIAGSSPWTKSKGFWSNGTQPMKLCWHQFEEHLIATDDRDGVS